jgi:hypothetical protein
MRMTLSCGRRTVAPGAIKLREAASQIRRDGCNNVQIDAGLFRMFCE